MQTLAYVFSRSRNPFAWAIRAASWWGQWSHCGLLLPGDIVDESLARDGGVVQTPLSEVVARSTAHAVMLLPVVDPSKAYGWSRETLGADYDWGGVLSILFRERDWQDESKWYCSERCAMQALKAGAELISPDMQGVSPTTLYRLMYAAGGRTF